MSNKTSINLNSLHGLYSARSTARTKLVGQTYRLPPTPSGNEKQIFQVGDTVISTGEGAIVAGVEMSIKDVMCNNGFYRYYANGIWHKLGDVE